MTNERISGLRKYACVRRLITREQTSEQSGELGGGKEEWTLNDMIHSTQCQRLSKMSFV